MGLGDQIAQNFIDNSKTIDLVRTMQFAGIGLFISVSTLCAIDVVYYIKISSIFHMQIFLVYMLNVFGI